MSEISRPAWNHRHLTALIALFAVFAVGMARAADLAGGTAADWAKHREAVLQDASAERFYSFDAGISADDPVPDLAGDQAAPLVFHREGVAGTGFQRVPGRWPGRMAARLDASYFAAPAPVGPGTAFTATLWFRKLGQGLLRGNDLSTNGMLLAVGNGYYEGWRVTTAYPSRRMNFEIGRPEGSVGFDTEAVADNAWHHLAVSWDGRLMRVYVDGEPVSTGAYAGAYTAPKGGGEFRVGFAGSGIGSVILDVDEAVLYRRALSSEDIFRDAYFYAALTGGEMARWTAANAAEARHDDAAARKELSALLTASGLNRDVAALVRLRLCDVDRRSGESLAAAGEIRKVLANPAVATRLHRQAMEKLLAVVQESAGASLPRALYEQALAQPELSLADKLAVRLNFGHSLAAAKDYAGARREYAQIADMPTAPTSWRRLARLCAARTFVRAGDYARAKAAYAQIRAEKDAPLGSEAEVDERLGEIARLASGKPAFDPQAGRLRLPKQPAPGKTFYVAPDGKDANSGTKTSPFATLEGARDAIRTLRSGAGLPPGGVAVIVRGGRYSVRNTLTLSAEDSGDAARPIVYRAAAGETPIFDAGVAVHGFGPVRDGAILARLPLEARDHVRQTDLKAQGMTDFGVFAPGGFASARGFKTHPLLQLYFNGGAMPLAQWPNEGFVPIADVAVGAKDTFSYAGDRPARWTAEKDAWLYGYWFFNWADSYEKIGSIDTAKKTITLAPPVTTYSDGTTSFVKGRRWRAVNVLAELDAPGEWYLDRETGLLYFYPPSDPAKGVAEVSLFDQPVLDMEKVSHISFEGLTWQNGRGDGLVINGGESCLLAGCTVRRFGGNGVQMAGGGHNGLLGCDLNMLGRGGTIIAAGDRKTLTPGGDFVENCDIHHFSLVDHTYTPAVLLSGAGNRIAHNVFRDAPSSTMRIEGNDNLIEYNDVGHVLLESDDQGASDMWANPTYRGNVFRYNYWHDMGSGQGVGQAGIRLDDWISGVLIYGNIFQRCADGGFGGVQINQGADNLIENNLFVDCKAAVSGGAGSPEGWQRFLASGQGKGYLQETPPFAPPYSQRYPALAHLGQNSENSVWRNIVLHCGTFLRNDQRFDLLDNAVSDANPGFANPDARDFSLKEGTPLWNRLSFAPIPFRQIGLYLDEYRKAK